MENEYVNPVERLKHLLNTPDEKAAVRVICRQILNSMNLNTAPVPLKPICQRLNLKVNYNNITKAEDSFLKLTPNGFEIDISKQKNWRRNRFTIAHELTHLILFRAISTPVNSFDRKQYDEVERLCDIGASELLINETELEKSLVEFGISTEGIKLMYDKFLVSYDALFSKLSEYLNANIVLWRNYARNEKEQKEYRVYKHFPKYKFATKSIWLPNGCTAKHISPMKFEMTQSLEIFDEFKVIMNDRITDCYALNFILPHSRNFNNNLPIFDKLTVVDESLYDECFLMLIFNEKSKFDQIRSKYLKNNE